MSLVKIKLSSFHTVLSWLWSSIFSCFHLLSILLTYLNILDSTEMQNTCKITYILIAIILEQKEKNTPRYLFQATSVNKYSNLVNRLRRDKPNHNWGNQHYINSNKETNQDASTARVTLIVSCSVCITRHDVIHVILSKHLVGLQLNETELVYWSLFLPIHLFRKGTKINHRPNRITTSFKIKLEMYQFASR